MHLKFKYYSLKNIQAPNFIMNPLELKDYIDFEVKRVYFLTKPKGNTGAHCHKIEREFFVMMQGECIAVIDKGDGLEEFKLKGPSSAIYVGSYVWHHFKDFSRDAILLALTSTNYSSDRSDYIENYDEYKLAIKTKKPFKKILIFGAKGNLGKQLVRVFEKENKVTACSRDEVDITNRELIINKIKDLKPDIIINATAYNAVDKCEEDSDELEIAKKINGDAVEYLAQAASEINAILVYYSSDYVFSGNQEQGYKETDMPSPISKYGQTKLMGESAILKYQDNLKYYLIRTSKLFGPKGKSENAKHSFFDIMLKLVKEKDELKVVDEEVSCFTYTPDLAKATQDLINQEKDFGVYHITNTDACTWYEAVLELFKISKINTKVSPVASNEFPRPAQRPKYSVLLNTKLKPLRSYKKALREYLFT